MLRSSIAALGLLVALASPVNAAPRPAGPPDVRRGEPYDGRTPSTPAGHALRVVPQTLLFLPRVAVTVLSRATLSALDWLERSGVGRFLHRVCFAADGRVVTLPTVVWELGLTPQAGASLTTNLLFGRNHQAGLHAEAAAGHRRTWHAHLAVYPLGLPELTVQRSLGLALAVRYDRRHDRPYYGRGYVQSSSETPASVLGARFDGEVFTADVALRAGLWRSLALRLSGGADWRQVHGATLPPPTATTSDHVDRLAADLTPAQHVALTFGLALSVGGPLDRPVPALGARAALQAVTRVGVRGLDHHLLLSAGAEYFLPLGHRTRRLGFRARAQAVARLQPAAVPILHLPCAGGPESLRGFVSGRLCGESLAALTLSYHQGLGGRLWLSLFVDGGGAFGEWFDGVRASALDLAGGAALAVRITRHNWMRLQVAGSRDGVAVFMAWGGAP